MSAPIVPASSPQPAQATQAAGAQTHLRTVGRKVLWEGAQDIVFEAIETK